MFKGVKDSGVVPRGSKKGARVAVRVQTRDKCVGSNLLNFSTLGLFLEENFEYDLTTFDPSHTDFSRSLEVGGLI